MSHRFRYKHQNRVEKDEDRHLKTGRALRRLHSWPNPQIIFGSTNHPLQLLGSFFIFLGGGTLIAYVVPVAIAMRLQDEEKKQLSLEKELQKLKKASVSGGPGSLG